MAYFNVSNAKALSLIDMAVHDEIDKITRAVIEQTTLGKYGAIIGDDSPMTTSTPIIEIIGTVQNPSTGVSGESLTIAGVGISLPANNDVDQIVAKINDAAIVGLTAMKTNDLRVKIVYETTPTNWELEVTPDSGNTTIGITDGTYTATNPDSVEYYNVWYGTSDNRAMTLKMGIVLNHFRDLGFTIFQRKNTETEKTFMWEISW
jgi:hypothetical protein